MKKLLSILMTFIMLLSSVAVIPSIVSAKKKTKTPNTYQAVSDYCTFGKGTVYKNAKSDLMYRSKDNRTLVNLAGNADTFYVRGTDVYYTNGNKVYSVGINGKNRKTLYTAKNSPKLIGGYGAKVIVAKGEKIQLVYNKKITTVKGINGTNAVAFNGKLYDGNKFYNIKTGKTKNFKASEICISKGGKYLYYINKNNNLKRMNTSGHKVFIEKNMKKNPSLKNCIHYAETTKIIYSKEDNSNEMVLYYKSKATDSAYRLCSKSEIYNVIKSTSVNQEESIVSVYGAVVIDGIVYLNISLHNGDYSKAVNMIAQINPTEGKVTNYFETHEENLVLCSVNGRLYYDTYTWYFDEDDYND